MSVRAAIAQLGVTPLAGDAPATTPRAEARPGAAMRENRPFDLVVYGASGFTGQLVAEYLAARSAAEPGLRWALAGRQPQRLAAVREAIGASPALPLLHADAADPASLQALAAQTKLVLTTVGPYQLHGSSLVAACAAAGTDYVDLCGEPAWMREMIDAHHDTARASGARIVFSCGFDSIPFDLGVWFVQQEAIRRFGAPAPRVKGRVRRSKGGFSGGTAASLRATLAAAARDPQVLARLRDPFALTPGFSGPPQPRGDKPMIDPSLDAWVAPFVMAPINTRNVHRSNFLLGHPWGRDFVYDEMIVTGPGEKGQARAEAVAADRSMTQDGGPQPGEGPSREEREAGFFDLLFIAEMPDGRSARAAVGGDRDPGYGCTSRMITESALCLLRDAVPAAGGVLTAAPAMAAPLIARLTAHAGMRFAIEA
jgi:short subunit dehydrogenase-like uncharacterized protein